MRQVGSGVERHGRCAAIVGAALAASLFFPSAASAQKLASLPSGSAIGKVDVTGAARPVQAWVKFCDANPRECDVNAAEPETVQLTTKVWRILNSVNRQVNGSVKPMTDTEHWGVVDRWDLPTDGYGDCEDFQLLKRKILAEQHGLSRRAMRMTVVIDEDGEGHAVLMVRTSEGDLILDNKRNGILAWHETGYVFVKREGQAGRDWVSLGDRTASPITTANR